MRVIAILFVLLYSTAAQAQQDAPILNPKPYGLWVMELQQEAQVQGIAPEFFAAAMENVMPNARILTLDRKQPEGKLSLPQYVKNTVTPKRIEDGRALSGTYETSLSAASRRYGVPDAVILALWGMETNYGTNTGGFYIVEALATLAYDGRRSAYFRSELLKALRLMQQEGIAREDFKGSWAGAMGQCQFMPTSFEKFATDADGDGRRDIWNSQADVFASIASYLSQTGWRACEPVAQEVRVPEGLSQTNAIDSMQPFSYWQAQGVRIISGEAPASQTNLALITVGDGDAARHYLVGTNFKVLLDWNRSRYFAVAVAQLADAIGEGASCK